MALGHVPGGRQNDAVERQYTPRLLRWIRLKRGRTSDEEAVLYKLTECHIRDHMRHKDKDRNAPQKHVLAEPYHSSDCGWSWHKRYHASGRQVQDVHLALAGALFH